MSEQVLTPQADSRTGDGTLERQPPPQPVIGLLYLPIMPGLEQTPPAKTLTAQKRPKNTLRGLTQMHNAVSAVLAK